MALNIQKFELNLKKGFKELCVILSELSQRQSIKTCRLLSNDTLRTKNCHVVKKLLDFFVGYKTLIGWPRKEMKETFGESLDL